MDDESQSELSRTLEPLRWENSLVLNNFVQKFYTRVSAAKETGAVLRSEGHPWPIPRSSLALVTPNSPRFFVG